MIVGNLIIMICTLAIVARFGQRWTQQPQLEEHDHEGTRSERKATLPDSVFISTPVSAFVDQASYATWRRRLAKIEAILVAECGFKHVTYAAKGLKLSTDVHAPALSLRDDLNSIQTCAFFLLVYPEPLPSSALVEVGYALCLAKRCMIFCPSRETLPFLLQHAEAAFSNVRIHTYDQPDDILTLLKRNRHKLFEYQ